MSDEVERGVSRLVTRRQDMQAPRLVEAKLNEQIYAVLSRAIADGVLTDDTLIREGTLTKLLRTTRAPVRQALGRLHDEGLLRRAEGVGYAVGDAPGPFREVDLQAVLTVHADGEPIRKAPSWERIYEQVERTIIHSAAFGSSRVNELELARFFDVGRLVARDVLTRLEVLGMLEKDTRQRWLVVALDAARVRHLNEMRSYLEPVALRQSVHGLRRDQLQAMRARLWLQIKQYPYVEAAEMNELEADLHVTCLSNCPNRELLGALGRTHCVLTLSKHVLGVEMPIPNDDPFLAEHLRVIDRLLDGDVLGAVTSLQRHLSSATPKVVSRLATFRSDFKPPLLPFLKN